jgi:glycosyltransferase involved in cell wall biosynthesis
MTGKDDKYKKPNSVKVAHLTSVHPLGDPRILHKECKTLVEAGYQVVLIIPHERNEVIEGVRIRAVPKPQARLERMTTTVWQVYQKALEENAAIYHFHDPELIPVGLLLKAQDKVVIYDIHEDYVSSIKQKRYLPHSLRPLMARLLGRFEKLLTNPFEIILAEKYYAKRFPNGTTILNYPIKNHFPIHSSAPNVQPSRPRLLYTGTATENRGALLYAEIVSLMKEAEVHIVGRCREELASEMREIAGERERLHIEGEGFHVQYERIIDYYRQGGWTAGLAVFPPTLHYMKKELTKFFEYMAAGIPIICSDFPVWQSIMEKTGAGLCVDSSNALAAVDAVEYLSRNPETAYAMGQNGRKAFLEKYNWSVESRKLTELYQELLAN